MATHVGGTVVHIGRLAGPESTTDVEQLAFQRLRLLGTTFRFRSAEQIADVCAALIPEVVPDASDGRIQAIIDRVFPFDEARGGQP
ncbi:hypothetical protein [Streptomyces sp. NPDC094149]|uniref:hypothetical protein n=1 Tax=Streptomyces sp. NPDC094149 TaxID=3155079 RepID=UPI003317F7E0